IIRIYPIQQRWIAGLLIALMLLVPAVGRADLRTAPAWFDTNGVGSAPDWHYRAPIAIPSGTAANSTIRIDVDFDALLSGLGISSGTIDSDSPRIVKSDGSLVAIQQYTDTVYGDATDAENNGQGEVRFILEDNGPATYYLYFDITQNGSKTPWPAANTINGNFEFSSTGQRFAAGWTVSANAGFDAQVRPGETVPVNTVNTDGTPHTGMFSYLLGSRSADEPGSASPAVTLSRTIAVPASNPGNLTLHYRAEGWDSSADYDNRYDFIQIRIDGDTVVGPDAGNYVNLPYSPNYRIGQISTTNSGYGRYNYWDLDTDGDHHRGMSLSAGDEPWFEVSASLTAYAGQTVTLEITSNHYIQYRTWFHVDDVAWSVVTLEPGAPQTFGADITSPLTAFPGSVLFIAASVDAQPDSVAASVYDQNDNMAAGGIELFDDGTHGDAIANDGVWSNDGSDPANPTVTIPSGTAIGVLWKTVILALDGSDNPVTDEQFFTIVEPAPDLSTSTKTVIDQNGGNLYPGDVLRYIITLVESAGMPATGVRVTDDIPAHISGFTIVSVPTGADDASTYAGTGPNGTGFLDVSGINLAANDSGTIIFDVTVDASAVAGTIIDNTAVVTVPSGFGASPNAATMMVAGEPASGTKQLYLRTNTDLSRIPAVTSTYQTLNRNNSNTWTLTPTLARDLKIDAGEDVTLTLLLRSDGNWGTIAMDLELSATGTTTGTIGTLTDQQMTLNGTIRAYTFSFTPSGPTTIEAGSALELTISNTSAGGGGWFNNKSFRVYTMSSGDYSQIALMAETVVNVDSVAFQDNAYPGGLMVTSSPPGTTVYVRAAISDPFGSFDISGAYLTLEDPSGSTVLSGVAMDEVLDSLAATKIFETAYDLPVSGSDGTWTATVTATEGTEGTITHQGTATLLVGAPLLTVLKSADSATAVPGDLITYTIQVINTGAGPAVNIEMDDAMSPYTALRIAYDGSGVMPFTLVGATGGVTLGTPVYSDDGGSTYGYSPLASGGSNAPAGFDGSVTHWRLPVNGTLGGNGTGFTMRYQVIVK
ncbi:MAG: DUF11 domain-containing protein, partial [Deltaproteobacteria bacterium]|nr:DUF11 domain-containing protein [Deltaproteobacteria bacterium]